ncbi:MAG: hypothetical protein K9M36_00825 [Candidatus Pacebacteria bacterium]|nr:hypothetical protein [Candidatus Paceibacterota bacterium]
MNQDMFVLPLSQETVEVIALKFPAFKNVSDIAFGLQNNIKMGRFNATISDMDAIMCCRANFCVIAGPELKPLSYSKYNREYTVNLFETTVDIHSVSIWECNSAGGFATQVARYEIKKDVNTLPSGTFPLLLPRLHNDRNNIMGIIPYKMGNELRIEFKRDGKIMPVLN